MTRSRSQARAAAQHIAFRAIADATYDWETWLSPRGRVLWVNPAVERITGYSRAESLAMPRYPLPAVHPEDRAKIEQVLKAAMAGKPGNDVELRVLRKDGTTRWAAISWQSFEDDSGKRLGFRTSVRDIHERKLAETRLREALVLAEQSAASRQAFLASTSHDLRTPLQCILGYAQLLGEGQRDAKGKRQARIIVQQTEALLAIVSDVLEMAALQVKGPDIVEEDFDLAEQLEHIVESVRSLARGKRVKVSLRIDARAKGRVRGDRMRVGQILTNLVGNALKFTERGSVHVEVARARGAGVRFVVEDTGIGIEKSALPQVFTPFARSAASIRLGYGGTGLGLSIAKALTQAMGGTIKVSSREGVGSRFTVELPLPAVQARSRVAKVGRRVKARLTVLVVDDSPVGRELTCEMLRGLGAVVLSAESGERALRVATDAAPALILMDLQMPGLDGAAAAQLIRAQTPPGGARPLIVALTANAFGRALALGPSGGMDGYLVKPVRLVDLKALLERVADEVALDGAPTVIGGGAPFPREESLNALVLRDLEVVTTADGRSLLEVTGRRVLEDTAACLTELRRAVRRSDLSKSAHLAHRVKGNCLVVGATSTAAWAQRLDDAMSQNDADGARRSLRALGRSFAELKTTLEPLIAARAHQAR